MHESLDRRLYFRKDLERLINPRSIAVVGASATPGAFGQRTLENLANFTGSVYGINPKYDTVEGRPCVPSLLDLPEAPDAVILAVGQHLVVPTLEQAAEIGAGGAIVYASGFSETGTPEGVGAQNAIADLARRTGVRVAGPNCVGLINLGTGAAMNFMTDSGRIIEGNNGGIAIVSQSGALGYTALQAVHRGVGVSHYLAAGNSADIDVCDYIAYLAEDPAVKAIVCLMEGVKSGRRFMEAARLAEAAGKPVIAYKTGNGESSGKAAMSHTGTLTGSTAAYRAAFEEVGAVWANDLEALIETASFFARNPSAPKAPGVGIMSTSGGAGVINADKAEESGLDLPELGPPALQVLTEVVPAFGSVGNPADLTAEVLKDPETFAACLDAFTADQGFGAVVVPFVFVNESTTGTRAPLLSMAAARTTTAVAAVWMNEWLEGPGSALLDADPNVTLFRSSARCMQTIKQWQDWHAGRFRRLEEAQQTGRISDPSAASVARRIVGEATGQTALTEKNAKEILAAYGISVPQEDIATTPDEAAAVAERFGYPLVLKVASPDIHHKTEVGGIRIGLESAKDVFRAAEEILTAVAAAAPEARIDGVSVQTMISSGPELLLGAHIDRQFGPLITVGSGGVLVELLKDFAVQLAPVSPAAARRMVESLRGYPLLAGMRGDPGYDVDAVVEAVVRFSELVSDLAGTVEEFDVNPLIVGQDGAVAADALMVLAVEEKELVLEGHHG